MPERILISLQETLVKIAAKKIVNAKRKRRLDNREDVRVQEEIPAKDLAQARVTMLHPGIVEQFRLGIVVQDLAKGFALGIPTTCGLM